MFAFKCCDSTKKQNVGTCTWVKSVGDLVGDSSLASSESSGLIHFLLVHAQKSK